MFYADLHIHSKFSRATGRDADLEHMAIWARKKGVAVLGTGDFTHPEWFREIRDKLVPAEPGLFRLRDDLQREVDRQVDNACQGITRFLLEVEISTIYKKGDRTRKVHHLIYVPDLEAAERLIAKLSRIGNLKSDGRPILGLDSRHLLEITLESSPHSYLIPAHIWTPWFAVLGSKSGFDQVQDCYGDLTPHIFALETGLSSDPPMNWRLSQLDRYTLVSNSDAHSPPKIGREACAFTCDLDYFAIRKALETRQGYAGTVEFFPEEGKYHLDGHRTCGVRLTPPETKELNGRCPTCGKELTIGVMHRVDELSDRGDDFHPSQPQEFRSLIPLPEVLAEIKGVGESSKQVQAAYDEVTARVGSELYVLDQAPVEDLRRAGSPLLAEAIGRMRSGRVIRDAGYDGEYGVIRVFEPGELAGRGRKSLLFEREGSADDADFAEKKKGTKKQPQVRRGSPDPAETTDRRSPVAGLQTAVDDSRETCGPSNRRGQETRAERVSTTATTSSHLRSSVKSADQPSRLLDSLDNEQRAAAEHERGPLLIIAGPGTGKTRTLTHRVAHLIQTGQAPPEQCLTITFSRRAAAELEERLKQLLPAVGSRIPVMTFHALGLKILQDHACDCGLPRDFRIATEAERTELLRAACDFSDTEVLRMLGHIAQHRRSTAADVTVGEQPLESVTYQRLMRERGWVDFDDLIVLPTKLFITQRDIAASYQSRWPWVSVDEFQDIDAGQYALLRLIVPPDGNVCVIGDPDQAIYGFRGADPRMFERFATDFPTSKAVILRKNYRSSPTIVSAALQAIRPSSLVADRDLEAVVESAELIEIHTCPSEQAEAEFVVHTIERLMGGSTFFSLDSGRVATDDGETWSFNDFAALYRTDAQADALVEAFARSGIPFQRKSHESLSDLPAMRAMIERLAGVPDLAARTPPEGGTPAVTDLLKHAADSVWTEHPDVATLLAQLHPLAERCGDNLPRFLNELTLATDVDLWDPRADRVSLLTLHASKGLEFGVVFLVGCEDGVLPLRFGSSVTAEIDEERRLFFVGMTRARQRLYLSRAHRRRWRGEVRELPASPFLQEIEEELLRRSEQQACRKPRPTTVQRSLFE